ncbi:malto-oligosyltrehalose synthase [Chryseolinea lacunae]|uniref:4-alpha-glucanotransferase n=1 Tax=Chryseolinea lacunae TaxID=2801331 RepID=A0ABS1KMW2_9BACT|nr:malto-oligosyltrehalose synthase [Chryseolinea lacunae]MBL0740592.1 malto-oligosyltrehalose synthase [Chryseolinea lacunae]
MIDLTSTYRIQFHKDFTFRHFERWIPYLHALGVRTIYASPIFEAVPGSQHGYDVVNPLRINPEVGTEAELASIAAALRKRNMQWLQDIVPNHMAFHTNNLWLMDVLEKGRYSVYATFFDLGWTSDLFHGRSIVPVLADTLENIFFRQEIQLNYHQQRLSFAYQQRHYPLHPRSYRTLFEYADAPEAVRQFTNQISDLHQTDEPVSYALRWHELLLQLDALLQVPATRTFMEDCVASVNASGMRLQQLLDEQTYKLTPWQLTDHRITFRRFFTVNELIGLNMQHEKVFQHYHEYILSLVSRGMIQGLRIDHVDGLYDPQYYLEQLRQHAGDIPIVVEKILKRDESLPAWPVQGTTGYEFLADVNQLMTFAPAKKTLDNFYSDLLGETPDLDAEIYKKKSHMLHHHMRGELDNLYHLFLELNLADKIELAAIPPEEVKECIAEFLIRCPVYRYYDNRFPLPEEDALRLRAVLEDVRRHTPQLKRAVRLVEEALLGKWMEADARDAARVAQFYLRCMQFTGPLMAKGVEDTLMYTYNRFMGHNEVGDGPEHFGMTALEFHTRMADRQHHWPLALNASSTHDTKRGEDVRARLNAFTELPDEWIAHVRAWRSLLRQAETPDENDSYFILQTLAGAWRPEERGSFMSRMEAYLVKALREGKRHTDWAAPDERYEASAVDRVAQVLDENTAAFRTLEDIFGKFGDAGLLNSLVQVVLKFMCPGVPDVYQGSEGWNFSLVDPDNRRPVAFEQREKDLKEVLSLTGKHVLRELWSSREDARIKVWLTHALCDVRSEYAEVFLRGDYIPLAVEGACQDHVLAFARKHNTQWLVTVIPRFALRLATTQGNALTALDWKDTRVLLPEEMPTTCMHLFTKEERAHNGAILIRDIFQSFPLAVLHFRAHTSARGAGVLMHITSLPGSYFVGDVGHEAYRFVDFLSSAKQSYWQVLPLNPTSVSHEHSPYSAYSSMAGNPLLISPDLFVDGGLLTEADLKPLRTSTPSLNFDKATVLKTFILDKAWKNFQEDTGKFSEEALIAFSQRESYWLNDFALFAVLRNVYQTSWTEWPAPLRHRQPEALWKFSNEHANAIAFVKWQQFMFDEQWQQLKTYSNDRDVKLVGDLPFYVIHDAADVWANRELFSLDDTGSIVGMAGVPPDYFSDEGQLWGMPVYRWDAMSNDDFGWWKQRLRKNMERYDLLRLDHFRAFASYWEVPASESTAVRGEWKPGPGNLFFDAVRAAFGHLPFIAEDLGEITPDVFELRDMFELPGMKVLHFAFGEDLPRSLYAPHHHEKNFLVYTGTHDNNTTVGWFEQDLTPADRVRLEQYAGRPVSHKNVHEVLMQLAYGSVSKIAIVPLQDLLGLDGASRMNTPGSAKGNWTWRLTTQPDAALARKVRALTILYDR